MTNPLSDRHFWGTIEKGGRWVSVCERCGIEQDIHDLTETEIMALPNEGCTGEKQ